MKHCDGAVLPTAAHITADLMNVSTMRAMRQRQMGAEGLVGLECAEFNLSSHRLGHRAELFAGSLCAFSVNAQQ
jgi:hypothetical protein